MARRHCVCVCVTCNHLFGSSKEPLVLGVEQCWPSNRFGPVRRRDHFSISKPSHWIYADRILSVGAEIVFLTLQLPSNSHPCQQAKLLSAPQPHPLYSVERFRCGRRQNRCNDKDFHCPCLYKDLTALSTYGAYGSYFLQFSITRLPGTAKKYKSNCPQRNSFQHVV